MTNNAGTNSPNGGQQVSIYSYQQLSSIYGNQLLYGTLQPGIANASVSISYTNPNIVFTIAAGTQLYFQRSTSSDPASQAGVTDTFIVKVVLSLPATVNFATSAWTSGNFLTSTKLYLIADWAYGTEYATFIVANDTSVLNYNFLGNYSTTQGNQVLIATFLNNIVAESYSATPGTAITYFHTAYEGQARRDVLSKVNTKNDQFMVQFAGDGSGVYVSQGSNFIGDNFLSSETVIQAPAWDANTSHSGDAKFVYLGQLSTDKITPPSVYTTYINNLSTGSSLTISSGNYANYYQVDFLRAKFDELAHIQGFYWESFLQPINGFSITGQTQQAILDYLATAPSANSSQAYPLSGIGYTILVTVRLLSAVNTSNVIWPESTIIFRNTGLSEITGVNNHSRLKLPVWTAANLGLS
jgi:hypothetical protein